MRQIYFPPGFRPGLWTLQRSPNPLVGWGGDTFFHSPSHSTSAAGRGDGPKAGTSGASDVARTYMGGLWAKPKMESMRTAPGEGQAAKPP